MPRLYCANCEETTDHELDDNGHLRCEDCGCIYTTSHRKMEWYGDDQVETYCPRCEDEEMHNYKNGKIKCQMCGLIRSL